MKHQPGTPSPGSGEGSALYGYVRPHIPELKVAEYERYRAVYCGLCRSIGRLTGQLSRITLTYDMTFFAAVRMILEGVEPRFVPMRCPAHPLNRRLTAEDNPSLALTAAVSAALVFEKNRDDLRDERGAGRLKPVLRRPLAAMMDRRAEKSGLLPEGFHRELAKRLAKLSEAEGSGSPSADETAGLFGDALAFAFSAGLDGEAAEEAAVFGSAAGKFVYLCDAADDLPGDAKAGRYNPLSAGWGDLALSGGRLSPMVRDSLSSAVPLMLGPMGEAAGRLDPAHPLTPVVRNIVYLGLPAMLRRVLSGEGAGGGGGGKEGFGSP